ncbi:MAG: calcium-binding protein, partial [Sulfurisoma sp.]|nr:calcium-binding protein [Sulfurisoma sp.]
YVVDNSGDRIEEAANAGHDLVKSSVSYLLADHVEDLNLSGTANSDGTGNAGQNQLVGNNGANRLDGGQGRDCMVGGLGDDSYVADNTGDITWENANAGVDSVDSSIAWTLQANTENLALTGTAAINGSGNADANLLRGNAASNTLTGNAGNDTLDGKAGTDILIGGTGSDTYLLGAGYGSDTIRENDATAGNADAARFLTGISADQIWLRHVGNNLEAGIIGSTDTLTLENWYLGSAYHVEQFKTADGRLLLDTQVENLVQAMAAFAPPAAGQTTLPPTYQDALAPVIAANWQ